MSRRRWVGGAAVVVLLACAGWLGLRAVQLRSHLAAARTELASARAALTSRDLAAAADQVARAGGQTRAAAAVVADPVWRLVSHLPLLGRTFRAGTGITLAADEVARQVLPPLVGLTGRVDPHQLRRPDGSVNLPLLATLEPDLAVAAGRAAQAAAVARVTPSSWLLGPVATARRQLVRQGDELAVVLAGARDAVRIAPALLGADRPRTYFVLVQQTSESRGTGGLIGGYAVVRAGAGRIHVLQQGNDAALAAGPVVLPPGLAADFVRRYGDRGGFSDWRNVNLSPDLPSVSRLVQARWLATGGGPLDGVVAMDAIALSDLLHGSGPVPVGGGRLVTPEELPAYLGADQYQYYPLPPGQLFGAASAPRKESLTAVARAVTARLTGGGGDTMALLRGLGDALLSGHLQMSSQDPSLAPTLASSGVDGALPATAAPLAYPVIFNTTGGKLDYYLDRSVRYTAGGCSGRSRTSTVTVRLHSTAPAGGLPPYVEIRLGDGQVQLSPVDQVDLSVFATSGASLQYATVDGKVISAVLGRSDPLLQVSSEGGHPIWEVVLDVAPGQTRTFTLHLREPTAAGAPLVPEQPLARPLRQVVEVPRCD